VPREVGFARTLIYYDGVQLAIARDALNHLYLAVLSERSEEGDTYLLVPITENRLRLLEVGQVELRVAFTHPEVREWFSMTLTGEAHRQPMTSIGEPPEEWLPEPGLLLAELLGAMEEADTSRVESTREGKAVVHLSFEPPEAIEYTRIAAHHLAQGLGAFQELIRQAYTRALQTLTGEPRATDQDQYTMEVFAFSGGSFTVHLQSRLEADMLGRVEVTAALEKID